MDKPYKDIFALKKFNVGYKREEEFHCPACISYTGEGVTADPYRHANDCPYRGVAHRDIPHPSHLPRLKKGTLVRLMANRHVQLVIVDKLIPTKDRVAYNSNYGPVYAVKSITTGEVLEEFRIDMVTLEEEEQIRDYVGRRKA